MPLVLDASVAIAFLAKTQSTPASRAFEERAPAGMLAPFVISLEVRHALLRLERRGLLGAGAADAGLAALESILDIQPPPEPRRLASWLALGRAEALGFYDAAYLDLALDRRAELASRDGPLVDAARRRKIAVRDLR